MLRMRSSKFVPYSTELKKVITVKSEAVMQKKKAKKDKIMSVCWMIFSLAGVILEVGRTLGC